MKSHHKKKAVIGIPLGLLLFFAGLFLPFQDFFPRSLIPLMLVALLSGIVIYIWGCLSLAKAKGYSTAIVLTVVLGVLFPAVVLLALPDKNKHHSRH
jgi:hypothetical protein